LEHKANQIFDTYLAFNISALYSLFDTYVFEDAPRTAPNRWDRIRTGEYREIRYGGRLVFGAQLERLGNVTVELLLQNIRIKNLENLELLEERFRLSQDSHPFPKSGIGINLSYEFAFKGLGSEVGYNALRFSYESYSTWGNRHTIHPKVTIGFADRTMPLSEQFRLGGRDSFFGTKEDERRGRQLLQLNLEYRYRLPFRLLFESYLVIRYDLGTISTIPEEIKFNTFRHGVGTELRLDTPIGLAAFGAGKSFYFIEGSSLTRVQEGPFLFYFMIGYEL
jgi:NTE family protein